ncbi:MAG: DUF397 domain-containing protein [Actinophytocola sp.]|uniref:DUF397 domain-containing protein n=1 Tax=Actinophytocola sp. TaxID=1872138 RepID=UPI003C73F79D
MGRIRNGDSAAELPGVVWRKSSYSGASGNCVELSWFDGRAGVRNSRDPHGPVLVVPTSMLEYLVALAFPNTPRGRR